MYDDWLTNNLGHLLTKEAVLKGIVIVTGKAVLKPRVTHKLCKNLVCILII